MRAYILLLSMLLPAGSFAATFSDTFATNPFSAPRWCERMHHVHWDSVNQLVTGANGASCAGGGSCCTCSAPPNNCSAYDTNAHQIITTNLYNGNTRSAATTFAVQRQWQAGGPLFEHVAVFSEAHPRCHAGFQAYVGVDTANGPGKYLLSVQRTDDGNDGQGASLCGHLGTTNGPYVTNIPLTTTTLPRYKLTITTSVSGSNVVTGAQLVDTVSGSTLASISGWSQPKPLWYNATAARRFSIGGVLDPAIGPSSTIPHDNFTGIYTP